MQDPIAVVGYSYRFPQEADCDDGFWSIIENGISTMTDVPSDRYNIDGYYFPPNRTGARRQDALYSRGGHFVKGDVAEFDASFFKMNAVEAEGMDPQLRLLLETTYHAFESAGIPMEHVLGTNTSVFVGNCSSEYYSMNSHDSECHPQYIASGSSTSMFANRLSWFYDLRGPSVALDTACSSSLVGLHLGCQSILNGEAEMSVVGGVQLQLDPNVTASSLSRLGFMSPDSHCYSFDERANGYSRGEGVGIMVLKRLSKAIEDGDTVRAVIRGTSVNQDGRTPALTQPSTAAQAAAIRKAYDQVGLDLTKTRYFEAHGTGTAVGDPIEVAGIAEAFSTHLSAETPMYVGSVKANIGHLEPCSGIAGMIKAILVLEKGIIPPNAMLETLNPGIAADKLHLKFPTSCLEWPTEGLRRASVNSFGFGGTNAHVVLDDARNYFELHGLQGQHNTVVDSRAHLILNDIPNGSGPSQKRIFLVSAADEEGVLRQASALGAYLRLQNCRDEESFLANLAFTLNSRRSRLPWKALCSATTVQDLQTSLMAPIKPKRTSKAPDVNFVFTGQGAQWASMGKSLLAFPVFKASIERSSACITALGSTWSAFDELYSSDLESRIDTPELAQPLCTILQLAVVDLLRSWGITPQAVVGHSSGEIAAAYCCGAVGFDAAVQIAYFRGQSVMKLLGQAPESDQHNTDKGSMVAVGLSEHDLQPYLESVNKIFDSQQHTSITISCGCINGPNNSTVTGSEQRIDNLVQKLQADNVFARKLNVPVAYHSQQMQTVAEYYFSKICNIFESTAQNKHTAPVFYSSVTGEQASSDYISRPEYWVANLVSQVKFSSALETLCLSFVSQGVVGAAKPTLFLMEIGPHCALERPIKATVPTDSVTYIYDNTLRRGVCGIDTLYEMIGRLVSNGGDVDLNVLNMAVSGNIDLPHMLVDLPKYQFNHSRSYWKESRTSQTMRKRKSPRHELLGTTVPDWNPFKPRWRLTIRESDLPWLSDHKINGTVLYPGAGMLVMAIEGARALTVNTSHVTGYRLKDVAIQSAMVIPADGLEVQLQMNTRNLASNKDDLVFSFEIFSVASGDSWKLHCTGEVFVERQTSPDTVSQVLFASKKVRGTSITTQVTNEFGFNGVNGDHANVVNSVSDLNGIGTVNGSSNAKLPESRISEIFQKAGTRPDGISNSRKRDIPEQSFPLPADDWICPTRVTQSDFYKVLYAKGAHFGDNFRSLHDISYDSATSHAQATVFLGDWKKKVASHEITEHLIHPTILDGMLQTLFAAAYRELPRFPTTIPTQFGEVYLSKDLAANASDGSFDVRSYVTEFGVFHLNGDITATATGQPTTKPLVTIRGLRLVGVQGTAPDASSSHGQPANMFHKFTWMPDITFLSSTDIEKHCDAVNGGIQHGGWDVKTEILARYSLQLLLDDVANHPILSPQPHIAKYLKWAGAFLQTEQTNTRELTKSWPGFENTKLRQQLIDAYAAEGRRQNLTVLLGSQLSGIVRGEIDPLEILFNKGLADAVYRSPEVQFMGHKVGAFLDLLGHKASSTKMIEIGAGTGVMTTSVLQYLRKQGQESGVSTRVRSFDYTDISPSFFAEAEERYAAFSDVMNYKILDIEKDPAEQGFELHSYDVVMAGAVLHATSSIANTLRHVKSLLKPGGYVVLAEPTNKRMASTPFVFGVLPGWWLATEKTRSNGPLLSKMEWSAALIEAGFEEPIVSLMDDHEESHNTSLMVSRSKFVQQSLVTMQAQSTIVITDNDYQRQIGEEVRDFLVSKFGGTCNLVSTNDLKHDGEPYNYAISLVELGGTTMDKLDEEFFAILKRIADIAPQILWINENCGRQAEDPKAAMIAGFSKSIMRERPNLSFIHYNVAGSTDMATSIKRVLRQFRMPDPIGPQEMDILEEAGTILIPRIVEAPAISKFFKSTTGSQTLSCTEVDSTQLTSEQLYELGFETGRLNAMHFKMTGDVSTTNLNDDELLIQVKATGINFKDVMVVLGQVPDNHIGQEFAGEVVSVGKAVSGQFQPGDRVCGIAAGSFRSHIQSKARHVMKIPSSVSYAEASAICVVYLTAHYGLNYVGRLQPGETVLIHAAAGGVGQAAIQLAQKAGADIYVTVSTQQKKDLLVKRYNVDPSHVFSSRHTLFAQQIMEKTQGKGIDVVLNSLSGHALTETWRCMASFGRFVEIGKKDIVTFQSLPMEPFERNVAFCSVDLNVVAAQNDPLMKQLTSDVEKLMHDESFFKTMVPSPLSTFKRSDFEGAFRYLQTGQHCGKAVVDWESNDTIKILPKNPLDYTLDGNATYVISGGLGGIGRSMATWMSDNGARHLALLSRSGPKNDAAKATIAELERKGVQVYTPNCDVTDRGAVERAMAHIAANMPPIKGCIQSSMVIKNQIFENYTVQNFNDIMAPKVQGTYNLHHALPSGLDFFILLSSVTGLVGSTSQTSYAAGNTFLDAFARFRHSQGEHCIALDLGIVEDIGYIAERVDVAQNMAMAYMDYRPVQEGDIHFLLKYACSPHIRYDSEWDTQITAALEVPVFMLDENAAKKAGWMRLPALQHLYRMQQGSNTEAIANNVSSAGPQLVAAKTVAEAGEIVSRLLAERLARSLAVPVEDIDIQKPPFAFGVDSLVAVELLYWFTSEIQADIPVVQILSNSTISQLGYIAAKKSQYVDLPDN